MKVKTYQPPTYNFVRRTLSNITGKDFSLSRKSKIKIEPHDTWSIFNTLSPIILELLKQYKETSHSYPAKFVEYREGEWPSREAYDKAVNEDEIDPRGLKQWEYILDHMIWSFQQLAKDDYEEAFHSGTIDFEMKEHKDGTMELVEGPNHTHQFDREGYKYFMEKIQKGVDLFAEYYLDLWD